MPELIGQDSDLLDAIREMSFQKGLAVWDDPKVDLEKKVQDFQLRLYPFHPGEIYLPFPVVHI